MRERQEVQEVLRRSKPVAPTTASHTHARGFRTEPCTPRKLLRQLPHGDGINRGGLQLRVACSLHFTSDYDEMARDYARVTLDAGCLAVKLTQNAQAIDLALANGTAPRYWTKNGRIPAKCSLC